MAVNGRMKAVLHYRATPAFCRQISDLEAEWLRIVVVDDADTVAFAREMQDADVLLHVLEPVKASTIDAAPNLKLIQKLGIGVDTIDLDAARRRGIAVCNMPGTNTRAVAELTLAADARRAPSPGRARRSNPRRQRMGPRRSVAGQSVRARRTHGRSGRLRRGREMPDADAAGHRREGDLHDVKEEAIRRRRSSSFSDLLVEG